MTFDSGGISIKPGGEDARDEVRHVAAARRCSRRRARSRGSGCRCGWSRVIGATENMPVGHAVQARRHRARRRPARRSRSTTPTPRAGSCSPTASPTRSSSGAERLVDLATLTGAIVIAFGSTLRRACSATTTSWCERGAGAGERTGELVWRLPLHPRLREADQGPLRRHRQRRRAPQGGLDHRPPSSCTRFAGDVPWAHLDIAGVGVRPRPRRTRPRAASGWGVRLLVELAASLRRVGWPAMDFDLPDDHELMRAPCATSPTARSRRSRRSSTARSRSPTRSSPSSASSGWMGIPFPEEFGGAGGDTLAYALAVEELTRVDSSVGDHAVRAHVARHAAGLPVRAPRSRSRAAARTCARAASSAPSG